MRQSDLALVVIRLQIASEPHLLLIRDEKWGDWTLVGGHVETHERKDWSRAAIRECNEELAPLRFGEDFVLLPLLNHPLQWGPIKSKSAKGELTQYTAQLFTLRFLKPPSDCLAKLPPTSFKIVPEAEVVRPASATQATNVTTAARALGGLERAALAWDQALPSSLF
ncbi:MAG: NUDIX hydrolase [Deltaproteobacteria bacterium]|nr:NUDIX hydrolase [Deltaproteobacteria bacterium]